MSAAQKSTSAASEAKSSTNKAVFVTGGNGGIGFALCKQLVFDKSCRVFLGSRSVEKGQEAVDSITKIGKLPPGASIKVVQCDVQNPQSIANAAQAVATELGGEGLYGLVNNAGTGFAHNPTTAAVFNTNIYGLRLVSEAFVPLLDQCPGSRVVNCGSGAGPMWVDSSATAEQKRVLLSPDVTWAQIDALVSDALKQGIDSRTAYGMSKACVSAYSAHFARTHPKIVCNSCTPGFIQTNMVPKGMGASKTPEQGTVAYHKLLFGDVGSGWYYGSDGLRSPLDKLRNPGEPEYTGK